jgi:hypothetical protein
MEMHAIQSKQASMSSRCIVANSEVMAELALSLVTKSSKYVSVPRVFAVGLEFVGEMQMHHKGETLQSSFSIPLFLENQPRSAYLMALEGNIDLDAVGYLDEWDPAVHAKFLAVKCYAALNFAVARSFFLGVKC